MATSQIGKIGEFVLSKEDWTQYIERLEHFFVANGIESAEKKRAVLLTVIGPTAYCRLQNLLSPAKLGETDYKNLVDAMQKHVNPTPSVMLQRFKFNSRSRQPGETVSTHLSKLRSIAEFCNFGELLDDMLTDCIVCRINDDKMQHRLLAESCLILKRAIEIAYSLETVAQNVYGTLQPTGNSGNEAVHKVATARVCFRCAKTNHTPASASLKMANATIVAKWDTSRQPATR